jgi:hypothetical protein
MKPTLHDKKNCMILEHFTKGFLIKLIQVSFNSLPLKCLQPLHNGNSQFLSRGPKRILYLLLVVDENGG